MARGQGDMSCTKYLLFFFNALFCICGLAILAVGLWVRFDKSLSEHVGDEAGQTLYSGAYVIMAFGAFIVVVTFLGCCGAIRDSQCMLFTFFLILLVVFMALVAAGVYVLVKKDGIKKQVKTFLANSDAEAVKAIENELECCTGSPMCTPIKWMANPCEDAIYDEIKMHAFIVGGVAIGVAVIIIIGMVLSMCLCCAVRKADYSI